MYLEETNETSWQRPFTSKRYIQGPFSENLITMWPEFKLILGDIEEKYKGYHSSAFHLLVGPDLKAPDFKKTCYHTREDGIPIHSISSDLGEYELSMESFCDIRRVPASYSRLRIYNKNAWSVSGEMAVIARTGLETCLVGMHIHGYAHFTGEIGNWGFLENTFGFQNDLLKDERCEIRFQGLERFNPQWQGDKSGLPWHLRHILRLNFTLEPGESIHLDIMFRRGETNAFDYDAEKQKAEKFWFGELAKIQTRPNTENKVLQNIVNSLIVQSLQMFCHPVGKDHVIPLQGSMTRAFWVVEAIEFLIALDRIGGFSDYTETVYELFFDVQQEAEGEEAGMVRSPYQAWASNTAGALWGLSRHLIFRNEKPVFDKYRNKMLLAFEWIEKQRSHNVEGAVKGIFPPMKSSDWEREQTEHYQSWCWTDGVNLHSYKWLARALEKFGDPAAPRVKAAYDNYMSILRGILREELEKNKRTDEILISNKAGVPMNDPPHGPYFNDGPAILARVNVIEPNCEASRLVENYFRNRGIFKNGLTGLMNDGRLRVDWSSDPWAGHTWYTSSPDYAWFEHWMRSGKRDKALATLEAQFKYAMTPEYYMNERYADNDPYFQPFQPNASANGRLLMMLFGYYNGEIDN